MAKGRARFGYHSVRSGNKVGKQFYGPPTDPVAQLIHRDQRLSMAITTANRSAQSAEERACKESQRYFQLLDAVISDWKRLMAILSRFPFADDRIPGASVAEMDNSFDTLQEKLAMTVPARQIYDLLREVDRGDAAAEETLKQLTERYHDIVSDAFDLVAITRDLRIASLAGKSKSTRNLAEAWFKKITDSLNRQHASDALEGLLIDVVAVSYIDAMWCAATSARATESQRQVQFWTRMATQSTQRFTNAYTALKEMRNRTR